MSVPPEAISQLAEAAAEPSILIGYQIIVPGAEGALLPEIAAGAYSKRGGNPETGHEPEVLRIISRSARA
jgi:hypothetical protein